VTTLFGGYGFALETLAATGLPVVEAVAEEIGAGVSVVAARKSRTATCKGSSPIALCGWAQATTSSSRLSTLSASIAGRPSRSPEAMAKKSVEPVMRGARFFSEKEAAACP